MLNSPLLQSPVLASKIKDYYCKLRQTLDIAHLSAKDIKKINAELQDMEIELKDQEDAREGLPAKWSELKEEHFPLFLSFDHFCSLLEADLGIQRLRGMALQEERHRARKMMQIGVSGKGGEEDDTHIQLDSTADFLLPGGETERLTWLHNVDIEAFLAHYWPRFDETLVKNLDPMLCYAEFVGVLQGSEESLVFDNVSVKNLNTSSKEVNGISHRESYREKRTSSYLIGHKVLLLMLARGFTICSCNTGS
jgi:hypothetical protein